MKYKKLISNSAPTLKSQTVDLDVEQGKTRMKLSISKTEDKISSLKIDIIKAKSKIPLDIDLIAERINMLELEKRSLIQKEELQKELF